MVEQSTAASHALAHEAEELGRLISRFQLTQTKGAAVTPLRKPEPVRSHAPVTAMKTVGQRTAPAQKRLEAQDEQGWDEF
jgi:methyl-accepting chemotaxis protein